MTASGPVRSLLLSAMMLVAAGGAFAREAAVISGHVEASPHVLFDGLRDRCDDNDFPDAPARAFRDAEGTVHLLATHFLNRQMLGPGLRSVARDCRIAFRGRHDPRPDAYDDYGWLVAPYTLDGRTVYSLVHNEFHGNERAALCPSRSYLRCWENSITWAVSRDGGYRFERPPGPGAVVAALPYRYAGDREKQIGYFNPTNIVARDGFFYAMVTKIDAVRGDWGVCLMRTQTLADPASWRIWDGSGFNIRQPGPYAGPATGSAARPCQPVGDGRLFASLGSLSWMPQAGAFVLTMRFQNWDRPRRGEVPGVYAATSGNLLDWSEPVLLAADRDLGGSGTQQLYPALLDPAAPDRNFQTLGTRPLLFSIEVERGKPAYDRKLVARPVTLDVTR